MNYFNHHSQLEVVILLSNNQGAFALERAKKFNVPTRVFDKNQFRDSNEVINWLSEFEVTHIVLAGFLWLLPEKLISLFHSRIINIHPSLLPKFGGKGMYGLKVHQAVKAAGETETGITIHEVDPMYDEGKILFQTSCKISSSDTPELIASKVNGLEYNHYPKIIEQWIISRDTNT